MPATRVHSWPLASIWRSPRSRTKVPFCSVALSAPSGASRTIAPLYGVTTSVLPSSVGPGGTTVLVLGSAGAGVSTTLPVSGWIVLDATWVISLTPVVAISDASTSPTPRSTFSPVWVSVPLRLICSAFRSTRAPVSIAAWRKSPSRNLPTAPSTFCGLSIVNAALSRLLSPRDGSPNGWSRYSTVDFTDTDCSGIPALPGVASSSGTTRPPVDLVGSLPPLGSVKVMLILVAPCARSSRFSNFGSIGRPLSLKPLFAFSFAETRVPPSIE